MKTQTQYRLVKDGQVILKAQGAEKILDYVPFENALMVVYPENEPEKQKDEYIDYDFVVNGEVINAIPIVKKLPQFQILERLRAYRDELMKKYDWVTSRHFEEREANIPTTLSSPQYQEFLRYRKELRNWANNCQDLGQCIDEPEKPVFLN